MSSKKVAPKETKAEKKPAAKKTATASAAKKPAAKETASKTASKKPAKVAAKPAKAAPKVAPKAVAKPAAKAATKSAKAAPKPTKPAKAAPKVEPKAAKPVAKAAAKSAKVAPKAEPKAAKPASKSNAKAVSAKVSAPKVNAKANAKNVAKEAKASKVAGSKVENVKIDAPKAEPHVKSVKGGKTSVAPEAEVIEEKKSAKSDVKDQPKFDYAILLEGVKKLSKSVMFVEIDEQEDRSNKKKMSSEMKNLEMKPTAAIRHKASLAEETQEELTERILKELEEQNLAFEREAASQMCTRCNRNLVSPEFWVDKHLGYCEECASILKLGQSKEARKVEYQLGGMGDSLDEEDEDIMGPDADDLKEAEEDLAELDD